MTLADPLARLVLVVLVIGLAYVSGRWWQSRDGTVRVAEPEDDGAFDPAELVSVGLTNERAEAYGLLLGSPTCAPCTTVKAVLGEVVADRPGLDWVYVDAADHLDLARAHHVMRVPTLFVLDRSGRILARTSGVPAKRDLIRVLDREGDLATP